LDRAYAANWEIDSARGHLDTAACQLYDAVGHLDGACRTRAQEILDHATAVLADLDRLREAL
jgi:hypothetical protein